MFTPQEAINRLSDKREIFFDEMVDLFRQVMEGKVTPVQLSAILMGLHVKTESVSEIAAAAQVMREFASKVDVGDMANLVDTCGTGGDKAHTFNISTTAAFVAAAAGANVAKHGGPLSAKTLLHGLVRHEIALSKLFHCPPWSSQSCMASLVPP